MHKVSSWLLNFEQLQKFHAGKCTMGIHSYSVLHLDVHLVQVHQCM